MSSENMSSNEVNKAIENYDPLCSDVYDVYETLNQFHGIHNRTYSFFNELKNELEEIQEAYTKNSPLHTDYAQYLDNERRRVEEAIMEIERHVTRTMQQAIVEKYDI